MKYQPMLLVAFTLVFAGHGLAADRNLTFIDPAKAKADDPDFSVQGEYIGEIGGKRTGVQVIALGGGLFDLVIYGGGLPGDGWDPKSGKTKASAKRDGDAVAVSGSVTGSINGSKMTLKQGDASGSLERIERKSPTLGAKPPKGAVVVFDGSSLKNFKKGARKTDEGLLEQGCTTSVEFGDHTLHIEFRTPYKPFARGQGRGNSGMYVQGRFEVQMLDSFGLEGRMNECGGIYSIKHTDFNMCFPPLSWQTYDVDFTSAKFDDKGNKVSDAKMTVRHNGVVIHKDVVCPRSTTAAPNRQPGPKGPIYLQNHGNPVRYRNIWVVEK